MVAYSDNAWAYTNYTRTADPDNYRNATDSSTAAWVTWGNVTYITQPVIKITKKRHYFDVMAEKKTWKHIQQEHMKVKVKTKRLGDFG